MRITFLSHEYPPLGGGAASALDNLSKELARKGHAIQIISIGIGGEDKVEIDNESRNICRLGVNRKTLLSPTLWELFCSYVAVRTRSYGYAKSHRPDIIFAFFAFPAGRAAIHLSKALHIPLVVSLRGSDVPGFSRRRWGGLSWLQPLLIRKVWKKSDLLLANGKNLQELSLKYAPWKDVVNISNGIDLKSYYPACGNVKSETLKVIFVGQLIERKRCLEFVAAAKWALKHGVDLELTIVGDGPLYPRVLEQVSAISGNAKASMLGHVARDEMPNVYRNNHVLVHLSKSEGLSNVLLEAMASGLAIVAPRSILCDFDHPDQFSVEVESVDEETVGGIISDLYFSADKLRNLRNKARECAEEHSWENVANVYEHALQKYVKK